MMSMDGEARRVSPSAQFRVLICIPTLGQRPLRRLLFAMKEAESLGARVVLAIDSTVPLAKQDAIIAAHPSQAIASGVSGYASIRNFALDLARRHECSHVVFFDDDQIPTAGWFASLMEPFVTVKPPPTVCFGPVLALGLGRGSANIEALRSPDVLLRASGQFEGEVYSGNTVIDVSSMLFDDYRFDPKYDRVGGEDTDFFRRLRAGGGTFFFARDAMAVELVPANRRTFRARFRAGSAMTRRKLLLGRSRSRGAGSRIRGAGRVIVLSLRGVLALDRSLLADAAFWAGFTTGRRGEGS